MKSSWTAVEVLAKGLPIFKSLLSAWVAQMLEENVIVIIALAVREKFM